MAERPLNHQQRKAIFGLAKTAGLNHDTLHDVVWRVTGSDSITKLTMRQAIRVIDALKATVGQAAPLGWLTGAQRGKIFALCRELAWTTADGEIDMDRLAGFVRVRFRVDRIEWVPMDKAGVIIEALKSMVAGGRGERKRKDETA